MTKKGSEGSGIVWCHDTGTNCVTFANGNGEETGPARLIPLFARVQQDSPVYDAALDELSVAMNQMVRETQLNGQSDQRKDSQVQLGLLRTGSGFLLVWKREVSDTERLEDLVDIDTLTDLEAMTDEQLNSYLRIDNKGKELAGGEWRAYTVSGGIYRCRGAGMGCFVTALEKKPETELLAADSAQAGGYFPTVHDDSPVYDSALNALAGRLDALVSQTQARELQAANRTPQERIGLAITGRGLLPVWKVVVSDDAYSQADIDSTDLEAMTDDQRDEFLRVMA